MQHFTSDMQVVLIAVARIHLLAVLGLALLPCLVLRRPRQRQRLVLLLLLPQPLRHRNVEVHRPQDHVMQQGLSNRSPAGGCRRRAACKEGGLQAGGKRHTGCRLRYAKAA